MHKRTRAGGTALVLAVSVTGLAATSGSAQATTHQPAHRSAHHAAGKASSLTVKITSNKKAPKLSVAKLRPGKTLFKVYRGNKGGTIQLLRLKPGYSLRHAARDMQKMFGQPSPKVVRRVDKNMVFYGGMDVPAKGVSKPNQWGVDLDKKDTYYVVNFNGGAPAALHVAGKHQRRSLPHAKGYVNTVGTVGDNRFKTPANDPHKGWMKTVNKAAEPHFVLLNKVKESTTNQDVQDYFDSGAQGPPPFALPDSTETNVISPGHSFVWKYHLSKGKYLTLCFYPSKSDGMPHAFMGMWKLFHLN